MYSIRIPTRISNMSPCTQLITEHGFDDDFSVRSIGEVCIHACRCEFYTYTSCNSSRTSAPSFIRICNTQHLLKNSADSPFVVTINHLNLSLSTKPSTTPVAMAPSTPQNRLAQVASHVGTTSTSSASLPIIPEVASDSVGK